MTSSNYFSKKRFPQAPEYDDHSSAHRHKQSVAQIFDALAVDVRWRPANFHPSTTSNSLDRYVSIEVAPNTRDANHPGLRAHPPLESRQPPQRHGTENPRHARGPPAIQGALTDGITSASRSFFPSTGTRSVERHRRALEAQAMGGLSLNVASVASFSSAASTPRWISSFERSDIPSAETKTLLELLGRVAVANAKVAYQAFLRSPASPAWTVARKVGRQVQRPL